MIEIKFEKQKLTQREKENYAKAIRKVVQLVFSFNKGLKEFREYVSVELKMIFK